MQREFICNSLGDLIKAARKSKDMTQHQLAARLGITTRYLKLIENSGKKPSYNLLGSIIFELDLPTDKVFCTEQGCLSKGVCDQW